MKKGITALLILDGFGINPDPTYNAIARAGTPFIDSLKARYPHGQIAASGMDVGLPRGQMGNSEVGHLNIGAGRVVYQELTRITKSIEDGDFFERPALVHALENVKATGGKLHLMGLISDGGVHSHIEHFYAMLRMAKQAGLPNTYVHCFMDGRDVPPSSGKGYIQQLEAYMAEIGYGSVATVAGRYYAMDRDTRWERVQKAYEAIVCGEGNYADSAERAMQDSYDAGVTDEFVVPCVVRKDGAPTATVREGDSVVFMNFRPDRTRELTRSMIYPDFADFERKGGYQKVYFASLTQYDVKFTNLEVAYHPESMDNTFGEYFSGLGGKQLRIAETTKYAHVTFFFNGGVEKPNPGEDRVLIPTPTVATFDLKPEMSAYEVAAEAVRRVESGQYDAMILNFANCDMVGHTGIMEAAEAAVRTVDECVRKVVTAVLAASGRAIITADHGNADLMVDPETGEAFTAHTTNPVPFILVDDERLGANIREGGRLGDIVPTMLELMEVAQPAEMTGKSLLGK